jgi:class 3 adenylate cyclase
VAEEAERRQLTLMFCDLVGSTPLASRFDPEDLRDIFRAYHRTVTEAIVRFDGFVAKYMGDGVLAYFGYPQAHEDDAERAFVRGWAPSTPWRGWSPPKAWPCASASPRGSSLSAI